MSISPRAKLLVGWEVRPSLSVSQNGDRAEVLHAIEKYFGCGGIRPDGSDKTLEMGNEASPGHPGACHSPLRGLPAVIWQAVRLRAFRIHLPTLADSAHLSRDGLIEIVELARVMSPSGRRRYDAEALLAKLRQGEGIVCASGNGG